MTVGLMRWWSKSPKAANQHEPGISESCSFSSSATAVVVVRACSFALSLCRRAASATANAPCVRFLERKARFTLERVDFAIVADFWSVFEGDDVWSSSEVVGCGGNRDDLGICKLRYCI